ncbi:MAG: hypothetical protein KJ622_15065 [Alphaproteobacteria bacterium]|nr:hypothetical protein [Alphaproteobacteria bacterium]
MTGSNLKTHPASLDQHSHPADRREAGDVSVRLSAFSLDARRSGWFSTGEIFGAHIGYRSSFPRRRMRPWVAAACLRLAFVAAAFVWSPVANAVECTHAARIGAMLQHVSLRCPGLELTEVGLKVQSNLAERIASSGDPQCAAGGPMAMLQDLSKFDPSLNDIAAIGNDMILDAALCQTIGDYFDGLAGNSDTPEFVRKRE